MVWPNRLKFARKVKGKTLRDVEKDTGISNPYLSQLENGKIEEPGYFIIIKLLNYYNLSHDDVFSEPNSSVAIDDKAISMLRKMKDIPDNLIKCVQCGGKYLRGAMCPVCFSRSRH